MDMHISSIRITIFDKAADFNRSNCSDVSNTQEQVRQSETKWETASRLVFSLGAAV
jgi:hypothetical protein